MRVAEKELNRLTGATRRGESANQGYSRSAKTAERANRGLAAGFLDAHGRTLSYIASLTAAGYAVSRIAGGIIRQADSYTELNNRLRLVTQSENQLIGVRGKLFNISQRTRTELSANAQLYSRISQASDALGRSQDEVLQVTELLNKQVSIGGNNASEAAAGLVQFAQGLASGRLQGDELRSVLENLQGVSQGLIIGFAKLRERGRIDFDVTRGNIRDLAAEGVLSADLLLDAILASADDTNAKFKDVSITVSGGVTQIRNALKDLIGTLDTAAGSSLGFGNFLTSVADRFEYLSRHVAGTLDTSEYDKLLQSAGSLRKRIADLESSSGGTAREIREEGASPALPQLKATLLSSKRHSFLRPKLLWC